MRERAKELRNDSAEGQIAVTLCLPSLFNLRGDLGSDSA